MTFLVKAYFNTDADGTPVDNDQLEWDDMPQCWYGPFDSLDDAISFMENDYPEDDTDLHDITAGDYKIPRGSVLNDPVEFRKQFEEDDIRPDHEVPC